LSLFDGEAVENPFCDSKNPRSRLQQVGGGRKKMQAENERSDTDFLAKRSGEPKNQYCEARLSDKFFGSPLTNCFPDIKDIVLAHYEKNSLGGPREFSRKEAVQRKILQHDFEKTKKENRFKELKKIKPEFLIALKPYFQIQTCYSDNTHFARVLVLCSCNDHVNCPVCRLKRITRLQRKYLPALLTFKNAKLLTLTLKRSGLGLEYDFEKLQSCLTKLKRSKAWTDRVSAYFGSKEIVANNVHAHIIIDGHFWDQAEISKQWAEITGDSFIVDIRRLKNPKKAIKEVFKYIVKDAKRKNCKTEEEYQKAIDLKKEVSDFRISNPNTRFVFSSKGLSGLGVCESSEFDEAFDEGELLRLLEGEAENSSSLDTIAISRQPVCPCCKDRLVLLGDFSSKEEAEIEMKRILAGNQYRRKKE
jgi:hypothetical protein